MSLELGLVIVLAFFSNVQGCGRKLAYGGKVIDGVDASDGSWPWQVLLLKNKRPICGGTLISPTWVVTAAHCVSTGIYHVALGEHDWNVFSGHEQFIKVKQLITHKKWHKYFSLETMDYDYALAELEKPALFNNYVQPICLPDKPPPVGTHCFITGWGKTVSGGRMHSILQQAPMSIVSNAKCDAKNSPAIRIRITDRMICGSGDGRISGCQGDSGGPFVCYDYDDFTWKLQGAVSHGSPTCDNRKTYTVFARITYVRDWIKLKTGV